MKFLEDLGFMPVGQSEQSWLWQNTFYVWAKKAEGKGFGTTMITKKSDKIFTGDKRENVLFRGSYIFDNHEFSHDLFKNIGVLEKINRTRLTKQKQVSHRHILSGLGFTEIKHNTWTKNIFLISVRPPNFETDRGKCLILKKPNIKKLIAGDRPANVVYKGRYFFDNPIFTEALLEKIGYNNFERRQKNKTYEYNRETLSDSELFIDEEFLNF